MSEFTALTKELEQTKAQCTAYAQDIQRMGRERVEMLNLLSDRDELLARVAVKNTTILDLRTKLAALQAKYDALCKKVAALEDR